MKFEVLPNYSAEKYYLLSELEQKCSFFYIDEIRKEEEILKEDCIMNILYVIGQVEEVQSQDSNQVNSLDTIKQTILQLLNRIEKFHNFTIFNSCLVVDLLITESQVFYDNTFRSQLEKLFSTLQGRVALIIIGITDHRVSSPGLEKCYDLVERILPGYREISHVANFITNTAQTMLGHDDHHEPDAVSNIFQALVYSEEEGENNFLLEIFEKQQPKLQKHSKAEEDRRYSQMKYRRSKRNNNQTDLTSGEEDNEEASSKASKKSKTHSLYRQYLFELLGCLIAAAILYYFLLRFRIIHNFLL